MGPLGEHDVLNEILATSPHHPDPPLAGPIRALGRDAASTALR